MVNVSATDDATRDSHGPTRPSSVNPLARSNAPTVRPPRSSVSSTGRAKTEQVVLECLYKVAELIVQSRVSLPAAEPDRRRGTRRSRFNLDLDEIPLVRESMTTWKDDVRRPLSIDIFWDGPGATTQGKVLLERWSVTFTAATDGVGSSTQDVIQHLKEVCKRISVLLRALFSFMRQLPAHRLFTQSYPSMLSYTMHVASVPEATRVFDAQRVATSAYAFLPIVTPFGQLQVATLYRRECDEFFTERREERTVPSCIFQDDFIIQDYVPVSPERIPASAPPPRATLSPPSDAEHLRLDSFVPVHHAGERFREDAEDVHQPQRSSPRSIPTPVVMPHQPFRMADAEENQPTTDIMVRPQPEMSKPMAIPRLSKGGIAATSTRDVETAIAYGEKRAGKLTQHAHSYESEHDVRLRGAAANPNVTAAPYGYGNVAIERDPQLNVSPSLAFQQRQQRLWEGGNDQHDAENGLHVSQTSSIQDEPNSIRNVAYHPISTPPRHPKTPLHAHHPRHRKISFNGAFVSEVAHSQSPTPPSGVPGKAESNPMPHHDAPPGHLAMFSVSPPFQVNPCELLSTSPAYSFSKNRFPSGSSKNVLTFATTDQFQLRLHRSTTSSATRIAAPKRSFSPEFRDSGVTTWGVSPDTPDSFSLALLGASESANGRRSRSDNAEAGGTSDTQGRESLGDGLDMHLPFAIEDCATTVSSAHSTGSFQSSVSKLESASVGEFLHQLKHAPRLSSYATDVGSKRTNDSADNSKDGSRKIHFQTSALLDDELAGFRSLREELAQGI
ncbi:hypothetical protein PsorP6_014653 [Peronosclerospora sorghi]|uniref:Uncharacterized protein n=1 Tax=Peronosclerospora sorghi TaxID=230839 RepID=A0ACC0VS08_9STRA|nr:hypothetical protein PsorP6_014653 [Peronosclerospora sorghi]